jgi:hypothetical protein
MGDDLEWLEIDDRLLDACRAHPVLELERGHVLLLN